VFVVTDDGVGEASRDEVRSAYEAVAGERS
jgi:hypothetical protein